MEFIDEQILIDFLKYFRGYFGKDIYVGGSFASNKAINIPKHYNDIDVFILGKCMESWAIANILDNLGCVYNLGDLNMKPYKYLNQSKRIKIVYRNVPIDLIFMDCDFESLSDKTASTLSKFFYTLNYDNILISTTLFEREKKISILVDNIIYVDRTKCTHGHYAKTMNQANEFNLKIVNVENKILLNYYS
jgi:hypothetical protein